MLTRFIHTIFGIRALPLLALLTVMGCEENMFYQPKYKAYEVNRFFADSLSVRPIIAGTVPRGHARIDGLFHTGMVNNQPADVFPFAVTPDRLREGRAQFTTFCSPCHGKAGDGQGIIVRRGFPQPPSFHIERLRYAPAGYFFDVITRGYGRMYDYSSRVIPEDRWKIVMYIRALQLSQGAAAALLSDDDRQKLEESSR